MSGRQAGHEEVLAAVGATLDFRPRSIILELSG